MGSKFYVGGFRLFCTHSMYIHMSIYVSIYIYTHIYISTDMIKSVYTRIYVYVCVYIYYTCIYIYTDIHNIHIHIHIDIHWDALARRILSRCLLNPRTHCENSRTICKFPINKIQYLCYFETQSGDVFDFPSHFMQHISTNVEGKRLCLQLGDLRG